MSYEYKTEKLEKSALKLTITVGEQEIKDEYATKLSDYAKKLVVPGFRKGHVPTSIIDSKYGDQILNEVAADKLDAAVGSVVEGLEEDLKPYWNNSPSLIDEESLFPYKSGDLVFSIKYDIKPTFELASYKGNEVEAAVAKVTDKEVDEAIEEIKKRNSSLVNRDGEAVAGDYVTMNTWELDENGEKKADTANEDFLEIIGPEDGKKFGEALLGVKVGDAKTLEGKQDHKQYAIEVSKVRYLSIPELDDDLAQDVSEKYKTKEDLIAATKADLEAKAEEKNKNAKFDALVDKLIAQTQIDVPDSAIDEAGNNAWAQMLSQYNAPVDQVEKFFEAQGMTKDKYIEANKDNLLKQVKGSLILGAIIKAEGIKPTDQQIEQSMAKYAETTKDHPEYNDYFKTLVTEDICNDLCQDLLLAANTFTEKKEN
ncbi:MAG: trigger factor [Sphaerochaetaceae bacterium]|jgi:trigger factor|nr:trigger factor [Sphaerochaetaceae bacterium]